MSLSLSACAWFSNKPAVPIMPAPTRVAVTIKAGQDVNPDAQGHGSPLELRLYELRGASTFQSADFFAIYEKDQATLGADMAAKKDLVIQPGDKKVLMLEPAAGTQYVGVFAAYRQLDNARWRAVTPIVAQRTGVVEIKLDGTRMSLETPAVAPLP